MLKSFLTAEEYISRLKQIIKRYGVDNVLTRLGLVVFYSGPSRLVQEFMGSDRKGNWERSEEIALLFKGSRIDDTFFGRTLWARKLKNYFVKVYANEDSPADAAEDAYLKVWGFISERFAKAKFQRAMTVVCGADSERVFLKYELPALITNPHLEEINGITVQAIREMYEKVSPDEAFNLVCLTELHQVYLQAKNNNKAPIRSWQDFYDRLSFFNIERQETKRGQLPLTEEQEIYKQRIIARYNLAAFYVTKPSSLGGPLVPSQFNTYALKVDSLRVG